MSPAVCCQQVIFSGRVQGVGFRQTTYDLAGGYEVSGYVKNLANGNVEMIVQGDTDEVNRFVTALCHKMVEYIRDKDVQDQPVGNWDGFTIRY